MALVSAAFLSRRGNEGRGLGSILWNGRGILTIFLATSVMGLASIHSAGFTSGTANTGVWSTKTPMPTGPNGPGAEGLGAAAVGSIVYATSGYPSLAPFYAYDTVANTWTSEQPLPIPLSEPAGVVSLNGLVYVIGGFTKDFVGCSGGAANCMTNATQVYYPSTNTWSMAAPIPTRRDEAGTVALGTRIFVMGGHQILGTPPTTTSPALNVLEAYDTTSNTWTTLAPMPTARTGLIAAAVGSKIYAVGGLTIPYDGRSGTSVVESYDPATNMWSTGLAPMLTGRGMIMGGTLCTDTVFVAGGFNGFSSGSFNINEAYVASSNSWTTEPTMPTSRGEGGAAVVGTTGYVIGGFMNGPGGADVTVNEAYTVTCSTTTTTSLIYSDNNSVASGTIPLGSTVYDNATVGVVVPGVPITGTVSYVFFNNAQCQGAGSNAGGGLLVGGVPPHSSTEGPLIPGTYSFAATYNGDSNYSGSASSCRAFTVTPGTAGGTRVASLT